VSEPRLLFNWRWLIASARGPRSATTRHVLLTLSLHMGLDGDRARPSEVSLARETGLSERAVGIHLQHAVDAGWITRMVRREGRGWARYEYQAVIPAHLQGTERRSGRRTEPHTRGTEPGDIQVPNDVRTNTTRTSTHNTAEMSEPTAAELARRHADCQDFLTNARRTRPEAHPRATDGNEQHEWP